MVVPFSADGEATKTEMHWQEVITASRKKYGTPRAEVEAMLAKLREPVTQIKPLASPLVASSAPIIPQPSETPTISEVPKTDETQALGLI
ncbi:MAG: hypothetical protein ABI042_05430 [Verrucomicrobiota bacterium]